MTQSRLTPRFLALLLLLSGLPSLLLAQERVQLPSQHHSAVRAVGSVALHRLPDVNTERLRQEDAARAGEILPYRYGTVIETDLTARRNGTWESLPGGHWLWRLRIQSRDAVSLSAVLTEFQLPTGAALYVYDSEGALVRGPYTRGDVTGGQLRTPMVRGENLIIEMKVPRNLREQTDITIGKIVHGYRSIFSSQRSGVRSKAGDCNIDVACDEADPWRNQVRSVARVTFESGGDTFICSGSLLNTTAQNKIPYFLTAEHCIATPEEAASMVFYWNYQNPTCRTPGTTENGRVTDDDPADQTSTGAVLRARYGSDHQDGDIAGKPDLTLVEIDEEIPPEYKVYFSGWSWEDQRTQESVTIHHPSGHGKRISFDRDPASIDAYGGFAGEPDDTHLRIGNWERGTTEGGSSGSPLFDTDKRVVGVLSGGKAGCGTGTSGAEDNNEPDWYGRLHDGFNQGDYKDATIDDWLDPTNSGTRVLDGLPQQDGNDDTPPARIEDLTVASIDTTSMTLTWTSPGDDGDEGTALQYELRYSTSPITSESDFSSASQVMGVPMPESAGTEQSATARGLVPDSSYYFAIRSIDDGQNTSPIGVTPETPLPDKIAPAPIEGFQLTRVNTSDLAVTLEWTATGDDGRRGSASAYELRYASSPIKTEADFSNATPVTGLPAPAEASATETFRLDESNGLEQGQTYHFALRAIDNAGNTSPIAAPNQTAVLTKDIDVRKVGPVSASTGSTTETSFVVTESQEVRVSLYDVLGRRIRVVFEDQVPEGFERTVQYEIDGLSSGPYFLRFSGETFTKTRRVMLVK